jgi:hypothetical protein
MPGTATIHPGGTTDMYSLEPIFQSGNAVKIWEKYCGFLDLTVPQVMDIQKALLLEQIDLVSGSHLGQVIMHDQKPRNIEEFRRLVPLTTYEDYAPYIGQCQEDVLPVKPELWSRTSGRSGEFKWVPYTSRALERHADATLADLILATANNRGEVNIQPGSKFLFILAPRPYMSGIISWILKERYGLKVIPPPEESEKLDFQGRIAAGFQQALYEGVDAIGAVATVLVRVGESFAERSGKIKLSSLLAHPAAISRLVRALGYSRLQRRALLPRDIWPVKGLLCGGTDAAVYRKKLEYYWGKLPHEIYGCTEAGVMAMQSWLKKGLTIFPYLNFYEFIPEAECLRNREDRSYQPSTVLMDELKKGEVYEVVITNYYGMPFLRYRPGDMVKVISLEEKESGIQLPQFTFHARADGLIYLYSIVMLDEKTIWQALENTGIKIEEWSVRKEYDQDWPVLRFYIEPKQSIQAGELEYLIHDSLISISPLYDEAIREVNLNPIKVKLLAGGSYQRYYDEKRRAGADLAHLKPPHMNASDAIIRDLVRVSETEETAVG